MDTSTLDLPVPVAARLRRPGWRDPRLLAGLALVAASVALGSWALRAAERTVPVYVARETTVPGTAIDAGSLAVADVRLGTVGLDRYLRADRPLVVERIAHYAAEVFGDRDFAQAWLRRPNPAFHDRAPIDVAQTEIGARRVEAILSRFEHGDDH